MNKYVTYGLIFVGGAAIGGGIGWFVTKKRIEKIMDAKIEEEVKKTREWYRSLSEDTVKADENDISEDDIEDPVEATSEPSDDAIRVGKLAVESYTERMNRRKEDLLRPERTRYDQIPYESTEDQEEEVDEVRLETNDDDPRSDIYVITADQFAHERYGYDKVTLYWWELERILSEEDMDILDVPDLLGNNWESKIGTEEKDIVYVRNENLETDYEVVVQHESFYAMRD